MDYDWSQYILYGRYVPNFTENVVMQNRPRTKELEVYSAFVRYVSFGLMIMLQYKGCSIKT